jgi:hypothetical protein
MLFTGNAVRRVPIDLKSIRLAYAFCWELNHLHRPLKGRTLDKIPPYARRRHNVVLAGQEEAGLCCVCPARNLVEPQMVSKGPVEDSVQRQRDAQLAGNEVPG